MTGLGTPTLLMFLFAVIVSLQVSFEVLNSHKSFELFALICPHTKTFVYRVRRHLILNLSSFWSSYHESFLLSQG